MKPNNRNKKAIVNIGLLNNNQVLKNSLKDIAFVNKSTLPCQMAMRSISKQLDGKAFKGILAVNKSLLSSPPSMQTISEHINSQAFKSILAANKSYFSYLTVMEHLGKPFNTQAFNLNSNWTENLKKFQSLADSLSKQVNIFNQEFERRYKLLNKKAQEIYERLVPLVNELAKQRWAFSLYLSQDDVEKILKHPKKYWEKEMENLYIKDNHKEFFRQFDELIDHGFSKGKIDSGFLEQLKKIERLLKNDFSSYDVLIPALFSIIEFKIGEKLELLDKRTLKIEDYERLKKKSKKIQDEDGLGLLCLRSISIVLENYFKFTDFKHGINKTKFNRNAILHGRFNPDNYSEVDVIKLIVLLSALCECNMFNPSLIEDN